MPTPSPTFRRKSDGYLAAAFCVALLGFLGLRASVRPGFTLGIHHVTVNSRITPAQAGPRSTFGSVSAGASELAKAHKPREGGVCGVAGVVLAGFAAAAFGAVSIRGAKRRTTTRIQMFDFGGEERQIPKMFRHGEKGDVENQRRPWARDMLKGMMERIHSEDRTKDDWERLMKRYLYGRTQINLASPHFVDEAPFMYDEKGEFLRRTQNESPVRSILYERKFVNPPRFRISELYNWEMPENYMKAVTLQELVDAGVHLGQESHILSRPMIPYIYSQMGGTSIIDLVQTAAQLNRACYYLFEACSKGAKVLLIGTKVQAREITESCGKRANVSYFRDWYPGGYLTSFFTNRIAVEETVKMRREYMQGAWDGQDQNSQENNKKRMQKFYGKWQGVIDSPESLPDIIVVADQRKESWACREARKLGIPCIALCDTHNDPQWVNLAIPANTSGQKSISLLMNKLTDAIIKGQELDRATAVGDKHVFERQFDPYVMSTERMKPLNRRWKKQRHLTSKWGSYEKFKYANPLGRMPPQDPFKDNFLPRRTQWQAWA